MDFQGDSNLVDSFASSYDLDGVVDELHDGTGKAESGERFHEDSLDCSLLGELAMKRGVCRVREGRAHQEGGFSTFNRLK